MEAERWREVEAVFLAALERDLDTRRTFLDQACRTDPALRQEVESLLKADAGASGFMEPPEVEPGLPDLLDRLQAALDSVYKVERELGGGGMSRIFVATETGLGRRVVIKVLPPELAAEVDAERFHREIRLAASLQHPHVVPVHSAGQVRGLLYYTMPFVEGESLRQRLEREGPLPIPEAIGILREVTDALSYAHRHGIIHRDLKPANILLEEGHALITDFGIAKALSSAAAGVAQPVTLTSAGLIAGTPAYMAPEQAAGDPIDHRADLYALGCLAYDLLTGHPPFTGTSVQALMAAHIADKPEPLVNRRADVPPALGALVTRLLEKRAADRPQSADEVLLELEAAASGVRSAPLRHRLHFGSHWWQWRVATLGIGFLLGLGVLFAWLGTQPRRTGVVEPTLLAVLPFVNLGDSGDVYFADGLSDAVRGKLAEVSGVQVIAGASSAGYRGSAKSPEEIARELGVRYLLVGKMRLDRPPGEQPQVRVSPELVEVRGRGPPTTRWQQPFEASLPGVFLVQTDIARGVAEALGVALDSTETGQVAERTTQTNRRALSEQPTSDPAAYDAYLRAEEISSGLNALAPGVLRRALPYYEQAVSLDSTFAQAWAQIARVHAFIYLFGTPTPAGAEMARKAAGRALALAPTRFEGRLALGDYYRAVEKDYRRALQQYALGRQIAPNNVDLLTNSALVEQSLGQWEQALNHLQQAHTLDPRAVLSTHRLAFALLSLRRYPEALRATEEARVLAPSNLEVVQTQAMVYLARGDLQGAQAVLRAVPKEVEATTLAAYMGYYWDLYWVLEEPQQSLLLRLGPTAFEDNRASWALVLAQTYTLRGETIRGRAYADSARLALEDQLLSSPKDAQLRVLRGLALAYLGRKTEAVREGERGLALAPISQDWYVGSYLQHQLVRIYLLANLPDKALDYLEPLIRGPYYLSPRWLAIDPTFSTLRNQPRFQRLVAGAL